MIVIQAEATGDPHDQALRTAPYGTVPSPITNSNYQVQLPSPITNSIQPRQPVGGGKTLLLFTIHCHRDNQTQIYYVILEYPPRAATQKTEEN